jgi:hypothetical protein
MWAATEWRRTAAVLALMCATLATSWLPAAEIVEPDRASPRWDGYASGGAEVEMVGPVARLRAGPAGSRVAVWAPSVPGRSRAEVWWVDALVWAPSAGRSARVALAGDGGTWVGSPRLWSPPGEAPSDDPNDPRWRPVRFLAPSDPLDQTPRVGVVLRGPHGEVWVRALQVHAARRAWGRVLAASVVGAMWLAAGAAVARQIGPGLTIILAMLAVGVLAPASAVSTVGDALWWATWGPWSAIFLGQKFLGHVGLFAVLAFGLTHRGWTLSHVMGLTATLAVASELGQRLAVARSPSLADVGLDLAGVVIGVSAGWLVRRGRPSG